MQLMLFGRIMTDGRLNARVKCDLSENLTLKANSQVISKTVEELYPLFLFAWFVMTLCSAISKASWLTSLCFFPAY